MSIALVSLLIGVGYDAYVVSGYAKEYITLNDQTKRKCPEVVEPEDEEGAASSSTTASNNATSSHHASHQQNSTHAHSNNTAATESGDGSGSGTNGSSEGTVDASKYQLKERMKLESQFIQKKEQEAKKKEQEEAAENKAAEERRTNEEREKMERDAPAPGQKRRVHCWVLVLAGKREVLEPFFIEPSSGTRRPTDDPDYEIIESVCNDQNYWVNMQDPKETKGVRDISFDLWDLQKWEYVFLKEPTVADEDETMNNSDLLAGEKVGVESGEADDQILDLPPSWVSRITISPKQYEDKYPGLSKVVMYRDAKVEMFAEYSQKDLLVKRLTYFRDEARTQVKEIHRFYKNRVDKLLRRSNYLLESLNYGHAKKFANLQGSETYLIEQGSNNLEGQRIHEWFAPGRRRETYIEALSEHIYEKGVKRELKFHASARLDGLRQRIELFDPKETLSPFRQMPEEQLPKAPLLLPPLSTVSAKTKEL